MDIEKEREAFEQHLTDTGLVEFAGYGFEVNECDEYLHEPTQVAWDSWLIGLNRAKAQAVLAQLDVNSILHDIDCYFDSGINNTQRTANNLLQSIYEKLSGEVKAQEKTND